MTDRLVRLMRTRLSLDGLIYCFIDFEMKEKRKKRYMNSIKMKWKMIIDGHLNRFVCVAL